MRYITATQIFSGKEFFATDTVLVLDEKNKLHDITTIDKIEQSNLEHFKGIITPGFINTHCHLELSHLKNVINYHTGIVDFGLSVMKHRNDLSLEIQREAMVLADKEMEVQGIVAVGDISNSNNSLFIKQKSNLYYHTFVELIGLDPERASVVFDAGKQLAAEFLNAHLSSSLAAHAPYSASVELIKKITDNCSSVNKPTSIHNQESGAENDFFETKTGDYLRLYETIKIPIDYFKATGKSSLQTVISSFNTEMNTLLVHNTFTNKTDIQTAKKAHSHLYWCLCANANLYIEGTLPNIDLLYANNCVLTLGTDSLASNARLSIIDEINTILKKQSSISLKVLLQAATYNGAQFLGLENKLGSLEKNRTSGINLIEGSLGNYTVKKLA